MKEVHPQYSDDVAMYLVGTDPNEGAEILRRYGEEQGYPWPIALPGEDMLADFRVLTQSTKIAFDSQGSITYRDGYGGGNVDTWRQVFDELASQ